MELRRPRTDQNNIKSGKIISNISKRGAIQLEFYQKLHIATCVLAGSTNNIVITEANRIAVNETFRLNSLYDVH